MDERPTLTRMGIDNRRMVIAERVDADAAEQVEYFVRSVLDVPLRRLRKAPGSARRSKGAGGIPRRESLRVSLLHDLLRQPSLRCRKQHASCTDRDSNRQLPRAKFERFYAVQERLATCVQLGQHAAEMTGLLTKLRNLIDGKPSETLRRSPLFTPGTSVRKTSASA